MTSTYTNRLRAGLALYPVRYGVPGQPQDWPLRKARRRALGAPTRLSHGVKQPAGAWTKTPSNNVPVVTYTRGNDLSQSLEGAGGIGGLLARSDGYSSSTGNWTDHNYYHADGNGNITYLVNSSQGLAAAYRYDPFGNLTYSSGSLAGSNVYRFSSKEQHLNSGLYYYGYRFYDPVVQRWLNRDPAEDAELFENLRSDPSISAGTANDGNSYGFLRNGPPNAIDSWGLGPPEAEPPLKLPVPPAEPPPKRPWWKRLLPPWKIGPIRLNPIRQKPTLECPLPHGGTVTITGRPGKGGGVSGVLKWPILSGLDGTIGVSYDPGSGGVTGTVGIQGTWPPPR